MWIPLSETKVFTDPFRYFKIGIGGFSVGYESSQIIFVVYNMTVKMFFLFDGNFG